ncbi:hypothetical protein EZY14_019385 [Kordia sp. TARA_039_SRF]|nr:hypothetical protein EZY14_019385 [Kordia sp. TARA_039_SRF]
MSKNSIVVFNNEEFEENEQDFYTFLMYKGKPFTGTLKDGNSTIEFVDGNAHGESFAYGKKGMLTEYAVYENGDCLFWKSWYPNGHIKEDSKLGRIWNREGVLVKDRDNWLYPSNQAPKTKGNPYLDDLIYLAPDGSIVAKTIASYEKPNYIFCDEAMFTWYHEILVNPIPEVPSFFYFSNSNTRFVWGWIWTVFQRNQKEAFTVLRNITQHENKEIAAEAAEMLNDLQKNTKIQHIKARWL